MKPSWTTAPNWAQFLAQDPDGEWNWYENRPAWSNVTAVWRATSGRRISHDDWLSDESNQVYIDSLEARP